MGKGWVGVLFALVVLVNVWLYDSAMTNVTGGVRLLPLDDAYIHAQYAKQLALGKPYAYNDDDPPTSGATSLIYPYLLAVGYALGWQGLALGAWAMAIGALCLFGAQVGLYRLLSALGVPFWGGLALALAYGLMGNVAWHAMSGMETALTMMSVLWLGDALARHRAPALAGWGVLLTLTRPEGGMIAVLAVCALAFALWRVGALRQAWAWLCLPLLALLAQPALNAWLTGSWVATGNQSKSIFGSVGQAFELLLGRVIGNFLLVWRDILTGVNGAVGVWELPPLLAVLLGVGLVMLWRARANARPFTVWAVLTLLALTGAVSTLDNAFWHYKRYFMPIVGLVFALAGVALAWAWQARHRPVRAFVLAYTLVVMGAVLSTSADYRALYAQNVRYIYEQPYQMALWLRSNTLPTARVAVHDVGLMRYVGERQTLDMVGLTTAGAAGYWRNGVGSVAEFLRAQQPDYIASYGRGHGYGLGYLEATRLLTPALAEFTVRDWQAQTNVALAGERQAIAKPDWGALADEPLAGVVDVLNVADLKSEQAHDYAWEGAPSAGFLTEVYDYTGACLFPCAPLEGGRRILQGEAFTLRGAAPNVGAVLYAQLHARYRGTLSVEVNGREVATRTLIEAGGRWYTLQVSLPPHVVTDEMRVRVRTTTPTEYLSARYTLWQGEDAPAIPTSTLEAIYREGQFGLAGYTLEQAGDTLTVTLRWHSMRQEAGDYRRFLHLYADIGQPPTVQDDAYPLDGNAPPGNWRLGEFHDTIVLHGVPEGAYTLAVGWYDPLTGERLAPDSARYDVRDGRLFLQTVEVGQ